MSQNAKMWAFGFFMMAVGIVGAYPYGHLKGKEDEHATRTMTYRVMLEECQAAHAATIRRELERESQPKWLEQALLKAVLGL